MPIYEYECKAGHVSEALASSDDAPRNLPCDTCGENATRIISAPAVQTNDNFKPFTSYSMGNPDQATQYKDVGYAPDGGCQIDSRDTYRKMKKRCGLVESGGNGD